MADCLAAVQAASEAALQGRVPQQEASPVLAEAVLQGQEVQAASAAAQEAEASVVAAVV